MQIDFHYYVIRILSEKAGFKPAEAQTIAYASQYVDDATDHKPIFIPKKIKFEHIRRKGTSFDPICTAHKGLQFLRDFRKEVQTKVYFCFHFLPPEVYNGQKKYDYITKPNSNFANLLLNKIKNNFKKPDNTRLYNLISLGIALHTYADTWAHQGFSGRHSTKDNNVEKIKLWRKNLWRPISTLKSIRNNLLPEIGHAEAYSLPDLPYANWKYKYGVSNNKIIRNNLDIFIDAAKCIYGFLCDISSDKYVQFSKFGGKLIKCMSFASKSKKKRAKIYKSLFPEIGFFYDEDFWQKNIIKPTKKFITSEITPQKQDYRWLNFHKAAFEQRNFVIDKIKSLD